MGPPGEEVSATATAPVIFVDLYYEYQPIIGIDLFGDQELYATAAFVVREDRDQSQVYRRNAATTPAHCKRTGSGDSTL
jgi:hypothetical protein